MNMNKKQMSHITCLSHQDIRFVRTVKRYMRCMHKERKTYRYNWLSARSSFWTAALRSPLGPPVQAQHREVGIW